MMKQLEKILVATDLKVASEDTLRMAIFLAKQFHSELILLHVIPEIKGFPMVRSEIRKRVMDKLKQKENDVRKRGVASVEVIVRFGHPFERIVEYSEELDPHLIMIGSGNSREKDFQLGSVVERVAIYASKPVWIVKQGARPTIRHLLCPVDFSEPSRRALRNAIFLSKAFQAPLSILHVFESHLSSYFKKGKIPGESKEKEMMKQQEQKLDRFLRGFRFEYPRWNKIIRRGRAQEEILRFLRETETDLLIMGSHGKTGLTKMFLGSTTEKVIRVLPCSVVLLKEEHLFRLPLEREIDDLERHFARGRELMNKHLTEGAVAQFEHCIRKDPFFLPAWEAMANALRLMGKEKEAKRSKEMASYIRDHLWKMEI